MSLPVRRTRDNAVIAGVCAGLARRWNVDPNLLRIALVVACLASGLGLVIYAVAILVVPSEGSTQAPIHKALPFTRTWPLPALVAALGLAGLVIFGLAGGWSGLGLLPFVIALVIWLSARRRNARVRASATDPTPFTRAAEAWRQRMVENQVTAGALPATALAAITGAPTPAPDQTVSEVAEPRPPRRGKLWGLAFVLSAVGIALVAGRGDPISHASALPYLAVVLVSLGITLLVAVRRGRPRLMGFATIIVLIATLIAWAAPHVGLNDIATGTPQRYLSAADLPSDVKASAGDLVLDFSNLKLTSDATVNVALGAGQVELKLPQNVHTIVTWTVGTGSASVPGSGADSAGQSGSYEHGQPAGGPTLHLNVKLGVGSLEVTE